MPKDHSLTGMRIEQRRRHQPRKTRECSMRSDDERHTQSCASNPVWKSRHQRQSDGAGERLGNQNIVMAVEQCTCRVEIVIETLLVAIARNRHIVLVTQRGQERREQFAGAIEAGKQEERGHCLNDDLLASFRRIRRLST
jgi:hypothetical protein